MTKQRNVTKQQFVPRRKGDTMPDFGGSLYMKRNKSYHLELPNGNAIVICYAEDKTGAALSVISSAWCTKTDLDIQAGNKRQTFKPGPKPLVLYSSIPKHREIIRQLFANLADDNKSR